MRTICSLLLCFFTSAATGKAPLVPPTATNPDEIKIMTYNANNLFDAAHDEGFNDYTFLPQSHPKKKAGCLEIQHEYYRKQCLLVDWTKDKVEQKLQQVKTAVMIAGDRPDILTIQEIENENIAKQLGQALGYSNFLITHSDNSRGIDIAVFYDSDKLEYIEHEEIDLKDALEMKTRPILRVHFYPRGARAGQVLGIYANHWPAAMVNPWKRQQAANVLKDTIEAQRQRIGAQRYHTIALGDFNSPKTDNPSPFKNVLTTPYWADHLVDLQEHAESKRSSNRFQMPPASYFNSYNQTWVRLDRILTDQRLLNGSDLRVVSDSFQIVANKELTKKRSFKNRSAEYYLTSQAVPKRFNPVSKNMGDLGYSDHFPVTVKIKVLPQSSKKLDKTRKTQALSMDSYFDLKDQLQ